ncbi:MAG: ECF transporter S component [Oliverpabstia sp.]
MNKKRSIKDDFSLMTILTIPIAIAINFICGNLALTLKLPVYLDCIGTFLVAMLAGPWVGCLTGFLSIIINSIMDPSVMPFSIIAGGLGLVAGFMARKGLFTNWKKFILSGVITTLAAVALSVIVTYIFFGGFDTSGNSIMIASMMSAGVPFWPAQIIGNFISEVPDKFLSLLVPFLVIRGMSDRYLYKFANGPVFIEARKAKAENK